MTAGGAGLPAVRARGAGRLAVVVAGMAVAVALSGCSQTGDLSARVAQWASGSGFGSNVGTLLGDGARIDRVVDQGQGSGALKASCGVLEDDASTADGTLPTPDTQLTSALSTAFGDDVAAADLCYDASPADQVALARAVRDVTRADALLESAVQQYSGLTGKVPSTTTTTVPGGGGGDPFGFGD